MNHIEWYRSTNVQEMMAHVVGLLPRTSDGIVDMGRRRSIAAARKFRLFVAAYCRLLDPSLSQLFKSTTTAIDLAELRADGHIDVSGDHLVIEEAMAEARKYYHGPTTITHAPGQHQLVAAMLCDYTFSAIPTWDQYVAIDLPTQANLFRDIVGNSHFTECLEKCHECSDPDPLRPGQRWYPNGIGAHRVIRGDYCYRCRGSGISHADPEWLTTRIRGMAEAAYLERIDGFLDMDRLGVLADALEDAGCTDEAILRHLRGYRYCADCLYTKRSKGCKCDRTYFVKLAPGERRLRGFWALDLLLGKHYPNYIDNLH